MSPRQDIAGLLRRRNLTAIPTDQQKLLNADDAWAVDLKGLAHGMAHVPGHVIETLKASYIAKSSSHNDEQSERSNSPTSPGRHEEDDEIPGSSPQETGGSPERGISWSRSPDPTLPVPSADPQSSIVRETPKAPPITLGARLGPVLRAAPTFEMPESSDHEMEDLPIEVPEADTHAVALISRRSARLVIGSRSPQKADSTQTTSTPPCAHPSLPIVPSSVVEDVELRQLRAQEKQNATSRPFKRMKPIRLENNTPIRAKPARASASFTTRASTKPVEDIESSNSTSNSIIPGTWPAPATQGLAGSAGQEDSSIRADNADTNDPSAEDTSMANPVVEGVASEDEVIPTIEDAEDAEDAEEVDADEHVTRQSLQPVEESIDPYTAFTFVYPSYTLEHGGNVQDFITACQCLDYLRRERGLRDCLYDDFIRTFSGFRKYVDGAGPHQEPLPAIEWFNNLPGPALFNEMVVKRANIVAILDAYPDEVGRAKARLIKEDNERSSKEPSRVQGQQARSELPKASKPSEPFPLPSSCSPELVLQPREVVELDPATPKSREMTPMPWSPSPQPRGAIDPEPANPEPQQTADIREEPFLIPWSPSPVASPQPERVLEPEPATPQPLETRTISWSPSPVGASQPERVLEPEPATPQPLETRPISWSPSPVGAAQPDRALQSKLATPAPKQHIGLDGSLDLDESGELEPVIVSVEDVPMGTPRASLRSELQSPPSRGHPLPPTPDGPLTQLPAPPSPIPVMQPPSSLASTPIMGGRPKPAPRPSQYFQKLASNARSSSVPKRRSAAEQAQLREYFKKRKSSGVRSTPSSSSMAG